VSGTKALGIATGQIAWVLVPLALLWGWVGWLLARQEAQLKLATPVVNHPPPKSPN
jgi:hypothetical protein